MNEHIILEKLRSLEAKLDQVIRLLRNDLQPSDYRFGATGGWQGSGQPYPGSQLQYHAHEWVSDDTTGQNMRCRICGAIGPWRQGADQPRSMP